MCLFYVFVSCGHKQYLECYTTNPTKSFKIASKVHGLEVLQYCYRSYFGSFLRFVVYDQRIYKMLQLARYLQIFSHRNKHQLGQQPLIQATNRCNLVRVHSCTFWFWTVSVHHGFKAHISHFMVHISSEWDINVIAIGKSI